MSKATMKLDEEWSDLVVFLSSDPVQVIMETFSIQGNPLKRAMVDAELKDESYMRKSIQTGIDQANAGSTIKMTTGPIIISYPKVAELSLMGEGTLSASGVTLGYDMIMSRYNSIYFMVVSVYRAPRVVDLPTAMEQIIKNCAGYDF
jgi:hypothetical protein